MPMELITGTIDDSADATVYVAPELSRATSLVALRLPSVEKRVLHRKGAGDTVALSIFVTAQCARTGARLGARVTVAFLLEAGPDGF